MLRLALILAVISVQSHAGVPASGTVFIPGPDVPVPPVSRSAGSSDSKTLTNYQILASIPQNLMELSGPEYEFSEVEFDPYADSAERTLNEFDEAYRDQNNIDPQSASTINSFADFIMKAGGCYQDSCPVFAHVSRRKQTLTLYLDGNAAEVWAVSTGTGSRTPFLNKTATSRIYDRYTSTRYPGGDFNGLGNMPYAVFISGGIAIHGTPKSNWRRLGSRASHGCIRLHPEHAKAFNRLVRANGPSNVWVLVD